jgi:transposase-like protein
LEAAKLRIVEESLAGPRLVSATAPSRDFQSALFAWRKAYREGGSGLLRDSCRRRIAPEPGEAGDSRRGRIEIVSANGLRFVVDCAVDVEALGRIMRGRSRKNAALAPLCSTMRWSTGARNCSNESAPLVHFEVIELEVMAAE